MRRVVISQKCSATDKSTICTSRFIFESEGKMWWDETKEGWCHEELTRTPHSDSYRRAYMGLRDTTGEPYLLERCPACQMPLPDLRESPPSPPFFPRIKEDMKRLPQPDSDEGAE